MIYNAFRCFDIAYNVVICISPSSPQTVTPTGNTTVSFNYWSNTVDLIADAANWSSLNWRDKTYISQISSSYYMYIFSNDLVTFTSSGAKSYYIYFKYMNSNSSFVEHVMKMTITDFYTAGSSNNLVNWTVSWQEMQKSPSTASNMIVASDTNCNLSGSTGFDYIRNNNLYNGVYYGSSAPGCLMLFVKGNQVYGYLSSMINGSQYPVTLPIVVASPYYSAQVTVKYKAI